MNATLKQKNISLVMAFYNVWVLLSYSGVQSAALLRSIILSYAAYIALPHFITSSHRHNFQGKVMENKMFFFHFLYNSD